MSPLKNTLIGEIHNLLKACWDDIAQVCLYWATSDDRVSASDWERSSDVYVHSDLNKAAWKLHEIVGFGVDLKLEIQLTMSNCTHESQRASYLLALQTFYDETKRIEGRIKGYFETVRSSKDLPRIEPISNDALHVLDAIENIEYVLWPFIKDAYKPDYEDYGYVQTTFNDANEWEQHDVVDTLVNADIAPQKINIFNDMPIELVTAYFGQLVTKKSKNGMPFMTADQLNKFIDRAFCDDISIGKLNINFRDHVERLGITKLFYLYYVGCKKLGMVPKRSSDGTGKDKYVQLLANNIEGFIATKVGNCFSNSENSRMPWDVTFMPME